MKWYTGQIVFKELQIFFTSISICFLDYPRNFKAFEGNHSSVMDDLAGKNNQSLIQRPSYHTQQDEYKENIETPIFFQS